MKKKLEKKAEVNVKHKVNKKAIVKKAQPKKGNTPVERDSFGFTKDSKSSSAILMLASKGLLKDVRRKFPTLSFNKLFVDLKARGFEVENKDGKCSITQPAKG